MIFCRPDIEHTSDLFFSETAFHHFSIKRFPIDLLVAFKVKISYRISNCFTFSRYDQTYPRYVLIHSVIFWIPFLSEGSRQLNFFIKSRFIVCICSATGYFLSETDKSAFTSLYVSEIIAKNMFNNKKNTQKTYLKNE